MPAAEDGRIKMEGRGIDLIGLEDIADIVCLKVQMAEDKRFFRVLVDIDDAGIVHCQSINFEWVDVRQRLLPAAFFEGNSAGHLALQLLQIDIDFRLVEQRFGDEPSREDRAPLNRGLEHGDSDDRRIRMCILPEGQTFHSRGEGEQLEM